MTTIPSDKLFSLKRTDLSETEVKEAAPVSSARALFLSAPRPLIVQDLPPKVRRKKPTANFQEKFEQMIKHASGSPAAAGALRAPWPHSPNLSDQPGSPARAPMAPKTWGYSPEAPERSKRRSEGFDSPVRAPVSHPNTPSPVKRAKREVPTFAEDATLLPGQQRVLREALRSLDTIKDSPTRGQRSRHALSLLSTVCAQEPVQKLTQADKDSAVLRIIKDGTNRRECIGLNKEQWDLWRDSWADETVGKVSAIYARCQHRPEEKAPIVLVNLGHILEPEVVGARKVAGFHLLYRGNSHLKQSYSLHEMARNPQTNVWVGAYQVPDMEPKISTYFPEDQITSPEDFLKMLSQGEIILQRDENCLMKIPGLNFLVRLYLKRNCIITSCFPLLYFGTFQPQGELHQITDRICLTSQQVKACCEMAIQAGPAEFESDQCLVVDIAKFIPRCPVDKGIYIQYPKTPS